VSCVLVSGPVVYFLQQVDRALSRISPFAAVGVLVGTVYWSAVTYGAVTVMQVHTAHCTGSRYLQGSLQVFTVSLCAGGGTQEGSGADGAGRPAVPAHGPAHHPPGLGAGQDGPLGRVPAEAAAEVLLQG